MDTRLLHPDAPPDVPIHRLSFEDWIDSCWHANRYRDAYIEDFGLEDARYAAVTAGGSIDEARAVYFKLLFQQPVSSQMALAVYDELPSQLQTLAQEHFACLRDDIAWRLAVEHTLAQGCRLWAERAPLRSISSQPAVLLYRAAAPADFPSGSSASFPFRRAGGPLNARASGRVIATDDQAWLEARYPGSACVTPERFLIAAPYAVMRPGGRPEKPVNTELQAILPRDFFEVDERPNAAYYVTARQPNGSSALLLGPFATHLEALTQTAVASAYVHTKARSVRDMSVSIGTGRIDLASATTLPRGSLNATLLEAQQIAHADRLASTPPTEPCMVAAETHT
jgi:hypothetical protein